jgi:hypothetical protein
MCQVNFGTEAWSWQVGSNAKRGSGMCRYQYCWEVGKWEDVVLEMEGARGC